MNKTNGYMADARGRLVPIETVREFDKMRDALVRELVDSAKTLQAAMVAYKSRAMGDVDAFIDLSAERYGVTLGGQKGNATLMSFDGQYKVQLAISERLIFDEGIQAAKALGMNASTNGRKAAGWKSRPWSSTPFKRTKKARSTSGEYLA